ncbi:MAG: DEAD/DEAH box helicase, partial [Mycobacteriaceae bacterium]
DLLLPEVESEPPDSPLHRALLDALDGGALFFRQLTDRAGTALAAADEPAPTDADAVSALWDLVWAGLATNDTLAPVRALAGSRGAAHKTQKAAPRGRYARMRSGRPSMPSRSGPPTVAGRWSAAVAREADPTRRAAARAEAYLERHGVLTRGSVETERVVGGFSAVYKVLRAMEDSGRCRRGYVVEGLGGAQFAVPGAIDRLRALSRPDDAGEPTAVLLAATDPAQPWGAALAWPPVVGTDAETRAKHRPARKAGALVVLVDGVPALYVERGGRSVLTFTTETAALQLAARTLAGAVKDGRLGALAVQRADGQEALGSPLATVFSDAGFRATPGGLRLRA